jgi:hypothetical protein
VVGRDRWARGKSFGGPSGPALPCMKERRRGRVVISAVVRQPCTRAVIVARLSARFYSVATARIKSAKRELPNRA